MDPYTVTSAEYPTWLAETNDDICFVGSPSCLTERPIALLCSRECPGSIILSASEWADRWTGRESPPTLASGYQTPVEKEVLQRLLRGGAAVARFPARCLPKQLPAQQQEALEAGHFIIASPFPNSQKRPSKALAKRRNDLLRDLARAAIILHAAPESRTLQWAKQASSGGLPLYSFDHPSNSPLFDLGAEPLESLSP